MASYLLVYAIFCVYVYLCITRTATNTIVLHNTGKIDEILQGSQNVKTKQS